MLSVLAAARPGLWGLCSCPRCLVQGGQPEARCGSSQIWPALGQLLPCELVSTVPACLQGDHPSSSQPLPSPPELSPGSESLSSGCYASSSCLQENPENSSKERTLRLPPGALTDLNAGECWKPPAVLLGPSILQLVCRTWGNEHWGLTGGLWPRRDSSSSRPWQEVGVGSAGLVCL